MKAICVERTGFPGQPDSTVEVEARNADVLRAVIAAGADPDVPPTEVSHRHAINVRLSAVKAAVNFSKKFPTRSAWFAQAASSEKSNASFWVGNAFSALLAYRLLDVPWLVDIEKLPSCVRIRLRDKSSEKRADFLGRTDGDDWHTIESKGRSSRPGPSDLTSWKTQARTITHVNRKAISTALVSSAFLTTGHRWDSIWHDPPQEVAVPVDLDPFEFFEAYYRPIINFLGRTSGAYADEGFVYVPRYRMSVALHPRIRDGVERKDERLILDFARLPSILDSNRPEAASSDTVFRDGIIIRPGGQNIDRAPRVPRDSTRRSPQPAQVPLVQQPRSQGGTMNKPVEPYRSTSEYSTQQRVIKLFTDELGYRYLGNYDDRAENSNVEELLLASYLKRQGYSDDQVSRAIYLLKVEALHPSRSLYENNKAVYSLLRYGVDVKTAVGEKTTKVKLIDWKHPEKNDFAIAEEVTLRGNFERRPDLVLYVNGIAVGVIELKNSRVSIGDGIRQLISNQRPEFNSWFFSTVQIVIAGNDSEGLQYGTVGTEEKYFLRWKEDESDDSRFKLDKYLLKLCEKKRLTELLYDFVLFDGGMKKLPRVHQYFGIKAAQQHVNTLKGGIIWHTQGSGKSIVMVLLAKWILENKPNARVVIVTDRDELDKQIEGVFAEAGEPMERASSGRDLMGKLSKAKPRLLCSLVHKFGRKDVDNFEKFIDELKAQPSQTVGDVYVFVDECHRTQSGKLHRTMKAILQNAVFIGFTGTPLLKQDKATSLEVFGGYIHTYKFSEAVEDEVVLDLTYEARDIDQKLGSPSKVDAWFDAKTKGLNDWQKAELREQWGTMQRVLSSKSRMDKVVADIVFDFSVKPRLSSEKGNAILVASSIYEACKYFDLFQKTPFKGKCAIITSYNPQAKDVTTEDTGANTETDKQYIYNLYTELLKNVQPLPGMTKTESYEEEAKKLFKKQPANMKLLVVVDKLLTGFDAPSCTYLYIDKSMQDHGLFQAICRTNRLDGEDKTVGCIVDYKNLFKKLVNDKGTGALQVYTSELAQENGDGVDPQVLMQERLAEGKKRLDNALEGLAALCEPIEPPRTDREAIRYFCGNTEIASDLKEREPQRVALYKGTASFVRAYANIADELVEAGYGDDDVARIKGNLKRYVDLRETIRKASGETIDLKAYEADMRHLIDTYIEASEPRKISPFDDLPLLELLVKTGIGEVIAGLPEGIRTDQTAVAETIENNVRSKIIKDHLSDPAFYERMSALLDEIIKNRKAKAIEYEDYLKRIADLAKQVQAGQAKDTPSALDTPGKRALFNNLGEDEGLALKIDQTVRTVRHDGWRGVLSREQVIKAALYGILQNTDEVERVFVIIKQQKEY